MRKPNAKEIARRHISKKAPTKTYVDKAGKAIANYEDGRWPKVRQNEKRILLAALEMSMGVITLACKSVNVAREMHYIWMRDDPAYAEAFRGMGEICLDFAESALYKKIQNGDIAAIIFYLKCRGKKRGYVETHQLGDESKGSILAAIQSMMDDTSDEKIVEDAVFTEVESTPKKKAIKPSPKGRK